MSPALATFGLVLIAGTLVTLPLLPAFAELWLKRDARPLSVIQQHGGEIRHFANAFRNYVSPLIPELRACVAVGRNAMGKLAQRDEYLLLGAPGDLNSQLSGKSKRHCPFLLLAGIDAVLPSGRTFLKEIYAAGNLLGGEHNTYRAILSDGDVVVQHGSTVMRWAHAVGTLQADHDCELYGRISSDQEIRLNNGCLFQRLNAPRIILGAAKTPKAAPVLIAHPANAPSAAGILPRRLFEGDLEICPADVIVGDLVVRGTLRVGANARIYGSIKSSKDAVLEDGVFVSGSLVAATSMHICRSCLITGLVIAEHEILIAAGVQCGTSEAHTTVSAPHVTVETGAVVFGTLWAREGGHVIEEV